MSNKRMLIMPSELAKIIDENRGDLSRAEFINFLIQNAQEESNKGAGYTTKEELKAPEEKLKKLSQAHSKKYATHEELAVFKQNLRTLLKKFIDFFIGYGLELGRQAPLSELEELTSNIGDLESGLLPGDGKEIKIEYK
jgi:hypothetical protein